MLIWQKINRNRVYRCVHLCGGVSTPALRYESDDEMCQRCRAIWEQWPKNLPCRRPADKSIGQFWGYHKDWYRETGLIGLIMLYCTRPPPGWNSKLTKTTTTTSKSNDSRRWAYYYYWLGQYMWSTCDSEELKTNIISSTTKTSEHSAAISANPESQIDRDIYRTYGPNSRKR